MQFRDSPGPAPWLNRKAQFRMLRMFGMLAVVLIAMQVARDPKTWNWMFPPDQKASETKPAAPQKKVDFSVRTDDDDPLPPGTFRSQLNPGADAGDSKNGMNHRIGDFVIEIDPATLAMVNDDNIGVRFSESAAFFRVLAQARDVPLDALEQAGRQDISFVVLMTDSAQFRGLPLSVNGVARRIRKIPANANDFGIEAFYEAWVFTEESGENPYRLLAINVPDDLPMGESVEVPVQFTGYFFKREGYRSVGGLHKAPLLIGNYLRVVRPEEETDRSVAAQGLGMVPYVVGFAVIVATALGITIWLFSKADREFNDRHVRTYIEAHPTDLEELSKLNAIDPITELQQQRDAEDQAAVPHNEHKNRGGDPG